MKIKKRLIFLLGVITFLMWKCYRVSPNIKNYSPVDFHFSSEEPIVFRENKEVYYCNRNSPIDKSNLIYELSSTPKHYDWNISVSPNSELISIRDNDSIFVINKNGLNKYFIGLAKSELYFNFEKDRFRWKNIQWSENSRYLLLINDKEGNLEYITTNEIYIYDTSINKLKSIGESKNIVEAYFDKNNEFIYYSFWEDKQKKVRKKSIDSTVNYNEYSQFSDSILFISFNPYDLQNHTFEMNSIVVDSWGLNKSNYLDNGIYLYKEDTLKQIMESSLSGKNFKGFTKNNHRKHQSYFLPGNRYYIFDNWSLQYNGILLVDTEKMTYKEMKDDLQFYFSLNSTNVKSVKNRKPKYLYELAWRTDKLTYNSQYQHVKLKE